MSRSVLTDAQTVVRRLELSLGSIDFLCAVDFRHRFPPHFHDTFAIGVIDAGALRVFTPRGRWIARPGSILAFAPGETHGVEQILSNGFSYRMLYPSIEVMARLVGNVAGPGSPAPLFKEPVIADPAVASALQSLLAAVEKSPPAADISRGLLGVFRVLVERHGIRDGPSGNGLWGGRDSAIFRRARQFLSDHFQEPILLAGVARHCGVSPFHLIRVFGRVAGVSPHAYLLQVRVNRARELLAAGHTVVDATYRCGFSDQSHLSRAFKRTVGVPPGRYLRSLARQAAGGAPPVRRGTGALAVQTLLYRSPAARR